VPLALVLRIVVRVALWDIQQATNHVVGQGLNKVADVVKRAGHILGGGQNLFRYRVGRLEVFRQVRLTDFFEVEAEARDSAHNFVDLIFHVALSDPHAVDHHRVIDLLLPDALVVANQVVVLLLLTVASRLETLYFILPPLPSSFFLFYVDLKLCDATLQICHDFLGALRLYVELVCCLLQLLSLLGEVELDSMLLLELQQEFFLSLSVGPLANYTHLHDFGFHISDLEFFLSQSVLQALARLVSLLAHPPQILRSLSLLTECLLQSIDTALQCQALVFLVAQLAIKTFFDVA